jgi:hypothetical protein
MFAERKISSTRQRGILPRAALGKRLLAECFFAKRLTLGKVWHSTKCDSGKWPSPVVDLCRVPDIWHSANNVFIFWPPNFLCLPPTVPDTPSSNLVHFSDFLLYFFNLFHLIDFFFKKCKFELQVHRITGFCTPDVKHALGIANHVHNNHHAFISIIKHP